jgi:hypothetical protein
VSGDSRADCGGMLTLVGDGLLLLVIESFGFDGIDLVDVTPVVAPCATLTEGFVHAGLGLRPVLDYGTGGERTFGAGHDGGCGER